MAIGSGLAAFFGVSRQSTYETYTAPTRFFRFDESQIKRNKGVQQGGGLSGGALAQPGSMRVVTTTSAEGKLTLEPTTTGFGILLEQIFGGLVTPVKQGATVAYLQTHPLVDNVGRYVSAQQGTPQANGTVVPFSGIGGKITSAEFSCEKAGLLKCTLEFDYRGETQSQTLVAPSYVANNIFSFKDLAVKLGASAGSETVVDGVTKVSIKIERSQADDRYYAGNAGLKSEPLMNEYAKVTGSFEADFIDKATFFDRFSADTPTAAVVEWVSPLLAAAATPFALRFKVPQIFFDDEPPAVDGTEILSSSMSWTAQLDGVNPLVTAEYMSTDVAS